MYRPFVLPLDPAVMEQRFAAPAPDDEPDQPAPEMPEVDNAAEIAKLRPLLDKIPAQDADLFELYYQHGKRQQDLATIFHISQAGMSYRLDRVVARLRFLASWAGKDLNPDDVRRDLAPHFSAHVVHMLALYLTSSCQQVVAEQCETTQGRVRHQILKSVRELTALLEKHPELAVYRDTFAQLHEAGPILHRNRV